MTHAKSPIEEAVAEAGVANLKAQRELAANGGLETASVLAIIDGQIEQLEAALRASRGKMKAAEEWTVELCQSITPNVTTQGEVLEIIKRIQADANAAQPEPRPLRELVEDGFTNFWVWQTERGLSGHISQWRFTTLLQPSEKESFVRAIGHLPSISIPKPTVTPK